MGMLMHHTWLNQQNAEEPKVKPVKQEEIPFTEPAEEPEKSEPARKPVNRRRKAVK
jgi:hypothetical protein